MKYTGDKPKLIWSIFKQMKNYDQNQYLFYENKEDATLICNQLNTINKTNLYLVKPIAIYTCLKEIKQ